MGKLFGTDGVRGVANQYPMTAEMALNIGRATALQFKRAGHAPKIIIGKDTGFPVTCLRMHSYPGFVHGGGCHPGRVLPTPGIAY